MNLQQNPSTHRGVCRRCADQIDGRVTAAAIIRVTKPKTFQRFLLAFRAARYLSGIRGAFARAFLGLAMVIIATSGLANAAHGDLKVGENAQITNIPRIGVNIEGWSYYGADQLSSNVLMNPGFEPTIDRAIVIVKEANSTGFADDTPWLARSNGFRNGGSCQVLAGASAGRIGAIASSVQHGSDGLGWFTTAGLAPPLSVGDIISVSRLQESGPPANWWVPSGQPGISRDQNLRASARSSRGFVGRANFVGRSADSDKLLS